MEIFLSVFKLIGDLFNLIQNEVVVASSFLSLTHNPIIINLSSTTNSICPPPLSTLSNSLFIPWNSKNWVSLLEQSTWPFEHENVTTKLNFYFFKGFAAL